MGTNLSKYGDHGVTSLSKELEFNIDDIESCTLLRCPLSTCVETRHSLDLQLVKDRIRQMNQCRYIQQNYVYCTNNRIELHFKDREDVVIALSNDGKYVGNPIAASSVGLWMYLDTNPFVDLL